MIFTETKIKGAYIIEPERIKDERGFFARAFCKEEFQKHGLKTDLVQCNISYNKKRGTLRGMHYQVKPFEEAKVISCTRGAIYDVILDLRKESETRYHWISIGLSGANFKLVYIPKGCAHGFQTLTNNAVVYYQMTGFFRQECARGVRWDDKSFKINWPINKITISLKDRSYKPFRKQ
jgi:dTDP-4-dehydrorhamnose 3,5-epimerase